MKVAALNPPVENCEDFSRRGSDFVPESAGCYALANASGDILYLGKAKNLRVRMRRHLKNEEKRKKTARGVASKFHYAFCKEGELPSLEGGWINQYKLREGALPRFNKVSASV